MDEQAEEVKVVTHYREFPEWNGIALCGEGWDYHGQSRGTWGPDMVTCSKCLRKMARADEGETGGQHDRVFTLLRRVRKALGNLTAIRRGSKEGRGAGS